MKPPYENNKVYAVAAHSQKGLKAGFVSAVYAELHHNPWVSADSAQGGTFFLVEPDEHRDNGGNGDRWDPSVPDGHLLALSEDDEPLDLPPSHVLSAWADRGEALTAYEARRTAGRQGAQTRIEREAAAKEADMAAQMAADRKAREESPLGQLKASTRGLEHAFVAPARNGRPARVFVHLTMSPDAFRKNMERRGATPEIIEAFLAAEDADL